MSYDPRQYWSSLHDRHPGSVSAVGYAALGDGFNRVSYRRRLSALRRLLRQVFGSKSVPRVLEGAVGVGAYAPLWSEFGVREWVGVDISPAAIERLTRLFPESRFITIDLAANDDAWTAVGLPRTYDLVTAIDVLYHLTDDNACERALATLGAFVRPGGALIISDVFVEHPHQSFAHVKRRPFDFYRAALERGGLYEVGRQAVFAVLSGPVPRAGLHLADLFMSGTWRALQKSIRIVPSTARDSFGAAAAWAMFPLDAAICRSGATAGVNLELAAFRAR